MIFAVSQNTCSQIPICINSTEINFFLPIQNYHSISDKKLGKTKFLSFPFCFEKRMLKKTPARAYQGLRKVSFSEIFVYVLNE